MVIFHGYVSLPEGVHSFTDSFLPSLTYGTTRSKTLIHSVTRSLGHPSINSFTHSFVHSRHGRALLECVYVYVYRIVIINIQTTCIHT